MKKIFMFLAVAGLMAFSAQNAFAQDENTEAAAAEQEAVAEPAAEEVDGEVDPFNVKSDVPLHQALKTKFIEGGVEAAKEVCRNTRGPVASIFFQGFLRMDQGIEVVEKTVVSYGSVQMSLMESGLSWLSLFIAIAPSLGFLGTVVGMIQAFDAIQAAGDISPNVVAGGMKVALITTVGGLIVAVILQLFYNYILSQIDKLTIEMEDASISLVDILVKYENK